jgi:hypothetical protein
MMTGRGTKFPLSLARSKQLEKDLKPERKVSGEMSGRELQYFSGEQRMVRELNNSFQLSEELFYREL